MEIIKDERVNKIIEKIKNAVKLTKLEDHIFITGGAIRNSLLNLPIHDLDIVVEANNGGIVVANLLAAKEKCFRGGTNPVIFPSYGTAKMCLFSDNDLKDINIEFVESRKCSYQSSTNCFGTIEEDSKRRDLTINSLYWNINDKKLYDFNGGIMDLTSQTLRTVNPNGIYAEDPIKMLRVLRFSAEYGWGIEKNTWLGIIQHSKRLNTVAKEKTSAEIAKILVSPNASVGIRKMLYCGVLQKVMPDIYDLTTAYESRNPMVTSFDHTMKVLDTVQPLLEHRLAALFHDIGNVVTDNYNRAVSKDMFSASIAADDLKDMKFSNDTIEAVEKAIRYHRVFANYADGVVPPDKKIRKFINLVGEHIGITSDLMNANNLHCTYGKKKRQALDVLNRIEELDKAEETKNIKLPIDGKMLISELGLKRGGPIIGKLLDKIKDAYFENPKITKEECLELAKNEIKVLAL